MILDDRLAEIASRLRKAGVDNPRLDAKLIVQACLGRGPEYLLAHGGDECPADRAEDVETMTLRREAREPMAHILGRREFWSLEFKVSKDVLCPRPDSETLIEAVLARISNHERPMTILDLGTGSGCLLLALLSEFPKATGIGIDRSRAAVDIAAENAGSLDLRDRATFVRIDWGGYRGGPFDIVIGNPPYIPSADIATLEPEVARFEPLSALDGGRDGLDRHRTIRELLPRILKPGGYFFTEFGLGQARALSRLFRKDDIEVVDIKSDLSGRERVMTARRAMKQFF